MNQQKAGRPRKLRDPVSLTLKLERDTKRILELLYSTDEKILQDVLRELIDKHLEEVGKLQITGR